MSAAADTRWMRLALALGRRNQGRCWPNPAVGCVIVQDNRVVGRGWTQVGGRPHAETEALRQAGRAAIGATAYVTLEPCSHVGKTPPCTNQLLLAGIKRVVASIADCDSRVAGRGFEALRVAGIDVTTGVCETEARRDHNGFFLKTEQLRPHVTLKFASSFDGRTATATGESKWITQPLARRFVHAMRARHDAVMVGGGTARIDDPCLTVRNLGVQHQPIRIIVSRQIDVPLFGQLARTARDVPVWMMHGKDIDPQRRTAWKEVGAELIQCEQRDSQLCPLNLLNALAKRGITRVLCEGGQSLAASLLAVDLVDEIVGFFSGLAIGSEGLPSIGRMHTQCLEDACRFSLYDVSTFGEDVMCKWVRRNG